MVLTIQRKLHTGIAVLIGAALLTAGCGANPAAEKASGGNVKMENAGSAEVKAGTPAAGKSRMIKHLKGETTIEHEPSKIAVTEYRLADPLLALGIKPIAMGSYMGGLNLDWLKPGSLQGVKDLGANGNPEAVLEAQPDFIIAWDSQNQNYEALSKMAPTIVVSETDDWRADFIAFGKQMNKQAEAEQWMKNYKEKAEGYKAKLAPKLAGGKTAVYMRVLPKEFRMQATDHRLAGILNEDLGIPVPEKVKSIKKREAISMEALPQFDADYLFIQVGSAVAGGDKEAEKKLSELQQSSIWSNLKAVKNKHVFIVPFYVDVDFPLANERSMELVAEMILNNP
jgi:iron complex transport system substrate-binding protein